MFCIQSLELRLTLGQASPIPGMSKSGRSAAFCLEATMDEWMTMDDNGIPGGKAVSRRVAWQKPFVEEHEACSQSCLPGTQNPVSTWGCANIKKWNNASGLLVPSLSNNSNVTPWSTTCTELQNAQ